MEVGLGGCIFGRRVPAMLMPLLIGDSDGKHKYFSLLFRVDT
ncbi:MAG: hypothetical protein ACKVQB_03845 [Bacteroidia bacterium]